MFGSIPFGMQARGCDQGNRQPCRCLLWLALGLLAPGGILGWPGLGSAERELVVCM